MCAYKELFENMSDIIAEAHSICGEAKPNIYRSRVQSKFICYGEKQA